MSEELQSNVVEEKPEDVVDGGEEVVERAESVEGAGSDMDDLFGDDDDDEDDDEGVSRRRIDTQGEGEDDGDEDEDNIGRRRRNYVDEDEDEEQAMYTRKFYGEDDYDKSDQEEDKHEFREEDVVLTRHVVPTKITSEENDADTTIYYAKVPPFLTIDPIPFDPPTFENVVRERLTNGLSKEEQLEDRLIDQNTIRWRYSRDDNQRVFKESNATIVQWSDGSYSLKLGDEYTDILLNDTDNTFLTVSHDQQELMQCVHGGEISKSLLFVPISTTSKLHQRLSKAIVRRNATETMGPRSMIVNIDPELEKKELEKKQSQVFRERRKKKQKEIEALESLETTGFGNNSYSASRKRSTTPMSYGGSRRDEYEEDDFIVDDEEEEPEYAGEEDDDDLDGFEEEEEEQEEEEEGEDEDADEKRAERLRELKRQGTAAYNDDEKSGSESPKRRKVAVIEDDEDD
ncbi:hypothetical protein Kpol_1062p26 [Vanderwaltozyma polyspora DSM 70294]|uniref:Leo1-like protein n=1 Tax=Vanderwaltozyma polyspora (strain ATCC 22028 / DSM 70294 / BCRC 21397 / CBS 2163 / NBRC 10782 / NRRL Y-8283 / UCD 57-17) TaxID=436907 RepID=A7TK83_VANPO|nr:uncharacterized protein Kpol_1062p26 [Vanderwaltozyma polyspora DSM 70294]EDO17318.1 hypothetical protein Kpol_1062p26 [Vanderwaltozyma polyspora DSM 70294]